MNNLRSLIFLIAGLLAGYSASSFFSKKDAPTVVTSTVTESTAAEKSRSIEVEQYYRATLDSLQTANTTLDRQVSNTRSELRRTKSDNDVLRQLVDTLVVHESEVTDTAAKLAQCDSLETTVLGLIASSGQRDSLYEDLATGLQAEVANRDSILCVQQQVNNAIRLSFDNSLAQQDLLSAQNRLLDKQLHRQAVKNKILSAGVFILTGVATYSLVRH